MAGSKKQETVKESPMEIKYKLAARSPHGGICFLFRGADAPSNPSALIAPAYRVGDILTLLKKGHFNFAQEGDILALP